MDWEKVVTQGLIVLAVSLAMGYMNKGASKEIEENIHGEVTLRMNKLYLVLGYVAIGLASIFMLAIFYYQEKEMLIVGLPVCLLFGGLGLICLLYYRNHELKFNDKKILVKSWKGKIQEIAWEEINEIKFHAFSGYLKLKGFNKKMTIHQHLVGLKAFTKKMGEKTKWNAVDLKLPIN